MMKKKYSSRLLQIIRSEQEKDGSFSMLCSQDPEFSKGKSYKTNFFTALIAIALSDIEEGEQTRAKAISYLQKQVLSNGSVNYWPNGSKESKSRPYPADLDDTFCTYAAFAKNDPKLISGGLLAKAVKLLTALEIQEGGPYKTWVVSEKANTVWQDVDLVVNANVAFFLKTQDISLPKLDAFFERSIKSGHLKSPYYSGSLPVIYFLSRVYVGPAKNKLISYLLKKQNKGDWGNTLDSALALCALSDLGYQGKVLQAGLVRLEKAELEPSAFHIDLVKDGLLFYAGSKALTAAIVLEAFNKKNLKEKKPLQTNPYLKQEQEVLKAFTSKFATHKEIKASLKYELDFVLNSQSRTEIMLLPYFFASNLKKPVSEKMVRDLCLISLLGWMAYRIYDDFLDEEGDPKRLPLANLFLKELISILNNLQLDAEANNLWSKILDRIDYANLWEAKNMRGDSKLPTLKREAVIDKSIGHALGPLLLYHSSLLKGRKRARELLKLQAFFESYIYTRQLSDDLHDWEKDFKRGQLNPVALWLLQRINASFKPGSKALLARLREVYVKEGLVHFGKQMLKELKQAKKLLAYLSGLKQKEPLLELLDKLEKVAKQCVNEGGRAKDFVDEYNG